MYGNMGPTPNERSLRRYSWGFGLCRVAWLFVGTGILALVGMKIYANFDGLVPDALFAAATLSIFAVLSEWPWRSRSLIVFASFIRMGVTVAVSLWFFVLLNLRTAVDAALDLEGRVTEFAGDTLPPFASGVLTMTMEASSSVAETWLPVGVLLLLVVADNLRHLRESDPAFFRRESRQTAQK